MAMSLLYALLEDERSGTPPGRTNRERADTYKGLGRKQKQEVRKALYDALYHILEYSEVNRDLSMIIGKALCNAINANSREPLQPQEVERFRDVLMPIVAEAIDDKNPPPEQKN